MNQQSAGRAERGRRGGGRRADQVRPEQAERPAPCTDWRVRELLSRLIPGTSHSFGRRPGGESVHRG